MTDNQLLQKPKLDEVWAWLADVPDPEIPVVSVVDLGIARAVRWEEGRLIIDITPTYSGCPATRVIVLDIELAMAKKGLDDISVNTVLSPPWTTDWISEMGRQKLKNYGIAPPVDGVKTCAGKIGLSGAAAVKINCPRCASSQTERISQFGSTPCKASYRCKSCLEPFDYFKAF